jgi:hypothetical protein
MQTIRWAEIACVERLVHGVNLKCTDASVKTLRSVNPQRMFDSIRRHIMAGVLASPLLDLAAEPTTWVAPVSNRQWQDQCEDCKEKQPCFGMLGSGKRTRWCSGCAKRHPGATNTVNKRCEDCGAKQAYKGMPADGVKRWCSGCANQHTGATVVVNQCEDCSVKQANFGLPSGKKRRWCGGCAKEHTGAISATRRCEDCGLKHSSWGMSTWPAGGGKKWRWCSGCAKSIRVPCPPSARHCAARTVR